MGNLGRAGFGASLEGLVGRLSRFCLMCASYLLSGHTRMTAAMWARYRTRRTQERRSLWLPLRTGIQPKMVSW